MLFMRKSVTLEIETSNRQVGLHLGRYSALNKMTKKYPISFILHLQFLSMLKYLRNMASVSQYSVTILTSISIRSEQ